MNVHNEALCRPRCRLYHPSQIAPGNTNVGFASQTLALQFLDGPLSALNCANS
jgi:hypothetical protein